VGANITLHGLKIVVDCAHGAAYHIAPNVFRELGAEVIEIGVEPNGLNINLECGATHPETVRQKVLEQHADVGIALDGDGDRIIMVDAEGRIRDGDELLYIIVKEKLRRGTLQGGVVGTLMSNLGLEKAVLQMGVEFVRASIGDRYIMRELAKRNWHVGGEPSGHILCMDMTTAGDGTITALQVLAALHHQGRSLAAGCAGLQKYPQTLLNVKVSPQANGHAHAMIQQALQDVESELGDKVRVLLRRSGTEPLMRIMVEGEDAAHVTQLAEKLARVVRQALGE
jgi:phosphoglucosamine mutase